MSSLSHRSSVYLKGVTPTTQEILDGTGAVTSITSTAESGTKVQHSHTGLIVETEYNLYWGVEDTFGNSGTAGPVAFFTFPPQAPVAPNDTAWENERDKALTRNANTGGWIGEDPDGFSASGLPAGLSISPQGIITGTPTTATTYSTVITNTNAHGATNWNITWEIVFPPPVAPPAPGGGSGLTCNLQLRL